MAKQVLKHCVRVKGHPMIKKNLMSIKSNQN